MPASFRQGKFSVLSQHQGLFKEIEKMRLNEDDFDDFKTTKKGQTNGEILDPSLDVTGTLNIVNMKKTSN